MKKFRLFKLILLTLFVFKILLTSSFADYDLETESKLWETLDKNLKEKKQEKQRQKEKEQEKQRLKQAQEEQKQKEQEEQRLKRQEERRLKREEERRLSERGIRHRVFEEEQRLKEEEEQRLKEEEQRQKEQEEQRLKQEEEEQRLKQEEEEKKQKEQREAKALLKKLFPDNELSIIAKVGNEIVTSYDLEVEIKYLMALSPSLKNLTQEQKINSAKESIIREKVKINEILKYFKLEQEADYIDKVTADTYRKLGLKNQLVIAKGKELLKSKGMHPFWSFAVTATSSQGVMQ